MSRRRPSWLLVAALLAVLVVLGLVVSGRQSSRDHSSSSDASDGTSALRLYTAALGHTASAMDSSFEVGGRTGLIFVFTPDAAYTQAEAARLHGWVASGGTLIYADESPDVELDRAFGLQRLPQVPGPVNVVTPLLSGVHRLGASPLIASAFSPTARQVALLRSTAGPVVGLLERVGRGRLVALTDPTPLTNGWIGLADDGRFAADLIALAPPGSPAVFDEYHHSPAATAYSQLGWAATPWGLALLWAIALLFAGFFARGRRFGPTLPLQPAGYRSSLEYVAAVGRLLQQTRARLPALRLLDAAVRRELAARVGLTSVQEDFPQALARRAPGLAQRLAEAEGILPAGADSDRGLFEAARRLQALAHPPATDKEV